MKDSNLMKNCSILCILLGVIFGFLLVEVIFLFLKSPGLLRPANLSGLFVLVLSCLFLYAAIGVIYFLFLLLIFLINKLLRLRFSSTTLAICTLICGPLFLLMQQSLQQKILGWYISLGSPLFFVPTGITLVILVFVLLFVSFFSRRQIELPPVIRRFSTFPLIVFTASLLFIILALLSGLRANVLGVFSVDEERNILMEKHLEHVQSARKDAPNFIVLTIECFRADEFNQKNCPFLWKLAQNNVYFSRYYVVSPATRPSVTSFFTSLYPIQHGCYNLALGDVDKDYVSTFRVSEAVDSLPEILQSVGYRTLMVTSNDVCMDPVFGFESVFHRFDAIKPFHFLFPNLEPFYGFQFLRRNLRHSRVFKVLVFSPEHSSTYFDAPRLNRTIKRELVQKDDRPFFLYVHYTEPHAPYYYHPYKPVQLNIYSPGRKSKILKAYRSELRAVDSAIADIFDFFEQKNLLKNTYVFITGDHGEEFFDHKQWGHGKQVYPESIHVPGILVLPPDRQVELKPDDIIENIDIPVTFAELAGIRPAETWQGNSLVSLFEERTDVQAGSSPDENKEDIALCQFDDGYTLRASAIIGNYQIIFRGWPKKKEILLFDLTEDPHAKNNLAGQGFELELMLNEMLHDALLKLEESSQKFQGRKEKIIDKKQLERLRTLGYIH